MKILVNASTIVNGGGIQAALSFLEYSLAHNASDIDFFYCLSPFVVRSLHTVIPPDRLIVLHHSPANPFSFLCSYLSILKFERTACPDIVYSIGFPSYVLFKSREVGRYTNPWEILDIPLAWNSLSTADKLIRFLKTWCRRLWAKTATYYETQTHSARDGISAFLGVDKSRIYVSPNSLNSRFNLTKHCTPSVHSNSDSGKSEFRIFCLAADHPHKNLTILPQTALSLVELGCQSFTFFLTLPPTSLMLKRLLREAYDLNLDHYFVNLGPLDLDSCLFYYSNSSAVFLPSLAEVFSATYIEAMSCGVPIVTSDLEFARDICQQAAAYFDPTSPRSAASALFNVLYDEVYSSSLVQYGYAQLSGFPDTATKHNSLIDWLVNISNPLN